MKSFLRGAVLSGLFSLIPSVASAADVFVVHGINGEDLNLPRSLPVDIAVNGTCALTKVTFGGSALVDLAGGSYRITVHPSTGTCSAAPVITQAVVVPAEAKNIGLVAQISDSGAPQLQAFVNDSRASSIVVNNASVGDSIFAGVGNKKITFYFAKPLRNGGSVKIAEFAKNRRLTATLIRTKQRRPFFKEIFRSGKIVVLYAVGSSENGTLVVTQRIDL